MAKFNQITVVYYKYLHFNNLNDKDRHDEGNLLRHKLCPIMPIAIINIL